MYLKTLLVAAIAGLAIASPMPQRGRKTQAERVETNRQLGLTCNDSGLGDGRVICIDAQGSSCVINKAGGGTCQF
ncbi:hypothetical protein GGTG_07122 [Gaeumannomyces tritici R3-111a-1]|uniref:Uncharacterized protein n=1 Tax=Gaeumannomyces tritici (strain R3-111a-1) TaxID=644352 RepID=J3P0S7_GAET3|nr:hypothetical protein GGTG_07122 [Gaeumannomyces tritici R3-111a-1]EJT77210.1 hypothetical protein GGTG_07122 [Gaeumannomyces tritici R3-111a-1]